MLGNARLGRSMRQLDRLDDLAAVRDQERDRGDAAP
jgi:deoxyribodipyrimidine photolyase-related protein